MQNTTAGKKTLYSHVKSSLLRQFETYNFNLNAGLCAIILSVE